MASPAPKSWSDATTVQRLSSHTYEAQFPDDWCIGSGMATSSPHSISTNASRQFHMEGLSLGA